MSKLESLVLALISTITGIISIISGLSMGAME